MNQLPKVSIIIACKEIDRDTLKCLRECLNLDYPNFEIFVLPDNNDIKPHEKINIIATGTVKPSVKRNIGMKHAKGNIFAFIDSDAYPENDWLRNGIQYFLSQRDVGAVTGPNLTPLEDNFLQKVGGDILASYIGLGKFSRRYQITKRDYETTDIMSCNFIISKEMAEQLDGFDESLLTGEDYKLGLEIIAFGKKLIYSPNVRVYHHRRPIYLSHLKQIWNYGRDKGILMREFFSVDKLVYFLPSLFIGWIIMGFILYFLNNINLKIIYFFSLLLYLSILLIESLCIRDKRRTPFVFLGIYLTHITYGIAFIKGLLTKK